MNFITVKAKMNAQTGCLRSTRPCDIRLRVHSTPGTKLIKTEGRRLKVVVDNEDGYREIQGGNKIGQYGRVLN